MFASLRIACLVTFLTLTHSTSPWDTNWSSGIQAEKRIKQDNEGLLEALLSNGEEKCNGKRCVHSDQCCPGSVCVDIDGIALQTPAIKPLAGVAGTCLPIYGVSEGEICGSDADCEAGMKCLSLDNPAAPSISRALRTCQPFALNTMRKKQYNDECASSSECDGNRGLCCQLIRRHRTSPRKICYYFSDPKSCIGSVDSSRAKPFFSHNIGSNALFKARIG